MNENTHPLHDIVNGCEALLLDHSAPGEIRHLAARFVLDLSLLVANALREEQAAE